MRGNHYDLSCFRCFEVSQASYIQDESITPQYLKYFGLNYVNPFANVTKICDNSFNIGNLIIGYLLCC